MKTSKLLQLLSSLSDEECIACAAFVRSTVFNQSKDVVRLWNFLQRQRKAQRIQKITKAQVFSFLFADAPYSDIKLRNLIRKLTKIIEDFLLYRTLEQQPIRREALLNTIYRQRNLFGLFEKSGKRLIKALDENPQRGSDYFLTQYQWRKQYYFHPRTVKDSQSVEQLREAYQYLANFHEIERLHMEVELRNQERIYAKMYDPAFFNRQQSHYAASKLLQSASQLIHTQDTKIYNALKALFYKNLEELSEDDRLVIYPALLNYAISKIISQEEKFTKEVFELYKTGVRLGLLLSNGNISGPTFYNIVIVASRLAAFEWTEHFMSMFESKISDTYASDYVTLSQANFYFYKKKFKHILQLLNDYHFKFDRLNLNAKSLLCRTYFELSINDSTYIELTENFMLAFEKHLQRIDFIAPSIRESHLNFTFALHKILRFINSSKKAKPGIRSLQKEIKEKENIYNRNWLLEILSRRTI